MIVGGHFCVVVGRGQLIDGGRLFFIGPFNSWDRVPYITTVRTGKPSIIPAYREFHRNFVLANYASQEAIDTDDGSSYYHTHHNFFVYAANGLKSDFGGQYNEHSCRRRPLLGHCDLLGQPGAS